MLLALYLALRSIFHGPRGDWVMKSVDDAVGVILKAIKLDARLLSDIFNLRCDRTLPCSQRYGFASYVERSLNIKFLGSVRNPEKPNWRPSEAQVM